MQEEINNSFYDEYGERWYSAFDDPVALLRAENKTKFPWIIERIQRAGLTGASVLDVGCGAGFLTNALAREGLQVAGVDISPESLRVARLHDETGSVQYLSADAYHLPFPDQSFDVVTNLDFLEHVEDPASVIAECARVLKPGGLFFFHTFNRNFLSGLVVIKLVEVLVKNTPRNMHVLRLFITPEELTGYCEAAGMKVLEMTGLRPVFTSFVSLDLLKRNVPKGVRFKLTGSTLFSYLGVAIKDDI